MKLHRYADVLEDLTSIVAQRGADFRYARPPKTGDGPACRYEFEGEPSCGLGVVFAERWGVPISALQDMDNPRSTRSLLVALRISGHTMTQRAKILLFGFQSVQDGGHRYDESLSCAIADANSKLDDEAAYGPWEL